MNANNIVRVIRAVCRKSSVWNVVWTRERPQIQLVPSFAHIVWSQRLALFAMELLQQYAFSYKKPSDS